MGFSVGQLASGRAVQYPRPLAPGPSFTGTQESGEVLTCAPGTWTGAGTLSYAYQWKNIDSGTGAVTDCGGAGNDTATYTLAAGDVGDKVYCAVTVTSDAHDDLGVDLTNTVNTPVSGAIGA